MPKYTTSTPIPRTLDQPWVPAALPLLDDEVAYKIHRQNQVDPLAVEISTLWIGGGLLDPGEVTRVTWLWDDVQVGDVKELTAPYDESDLPMVASFIPAIRLAEPGLHRLQYIVELIAGNPTDASFPIQIDLDKVAPNQGQQPNRLQFDAYIQANGVTDDYLADPANNDQVVAVVPPWPDMRLEDRVDGKLTLLPAFRRSYSRNDEIVASVHITQAHKNGAPIELVFEGDTFRTLRSNREYSAQYFLIDRTGWQGPASRTSVVLNALTPSPIQFLSPEVPQAFGAGANGRIDLEDARESGGVYMNILEIVGALDGDVVTPSWDLIPLPPITVGPFQVWPVRVDIPWPILAQGGFELVGGVIRAGYTWQRGTGTARPAIPRFVPVDLTAAGELNPDNPNYINPLLLLPTVKGETGDDVLTLLDQNKPATVELELGVDFQVGDELELIWNDNPVPVDTHRVAIGENPGALITFHIPWSLIEPIGNARVNLLYRTFNGVNRQRSNHKVITVAVSPIVGLRRTQYPDVNYGPGPDSGFIGCTLNPHPSFGVKVFVPGDTARLEVGDVLRLIWVGYASPNGNLAHVIDSSKGEWDSPSLTPEGVQNGHTFTVPFNPHVLLPGLVKRDEYPHEPAHGSATTYYQVIRGGVPVGASALSLVLVTLIRPNNLPPCIAPS